MVGILASPATWPGYLFIVNTLRRGICLRIIYLFTLCNSGISPGSRKLYVGIRRCSWTVANWQRTSMRPHWRWSRHQKRVRASVVSQCKVVRSACWVLKRSNKQNVMGYLLAGVYMKYAEHACITRSKWTRTWAPLNKLKYKLLPMNPADWGFTNYKNKL